MATLVPPPLPIAQVRPAKILKPRSLPHLPERGSGSLAFFGLVTIFVLSFSIVASGMVYLLWPSTPAAQVQEKASLEVPQELPIDVEKPKNLNEILKDAPPGERGMQQRPGQFPNPGFNDLRPPNPQPFPPPVPPRRFERN